MLKTIKDLIAKPAPWAYFVLVVALLIIVTTKSGTVNDLEAELDNANAEIIASETLTESLSDEIAVRNDAIAGLEASAVDVNARLNDVDTQRGELEYEVARLLDRLNDRQLTINDLTENPNCPVTE